MAFLVVLFLVLGVCKVLESSLWWIPGPWGFPRIDRAPHEQFTTWSKTYGSVFSVRLGTWPAVVVNGYDAVKTAFITKKDDFAGRPVFESYKHYAGGKSLSFSQYGPHYKKHRYVAMRTLKKLMDDNELGLQDIIDDAAERFVDSLNNEQEQDPSKAVHTAIGSILYSLCFGNRKQLQDDTEFCKMVLAENPSTELFAAGHQDDLLPSMLRSKKYSQGLLHMGEQLNLHEDKLQKCISQDNGVSNPCMMQLLVQVVKKQPHLAFLHYTTVELISAGSETSSSVLLWLILYMAHYPEAQARIQAELDAYDELESPKLDDLPFTQACMWEVMRLNTIVPFALPHSTVRSTKLNGMTVPKDTLVFINLWSVCRDPKIWKKPNEFYAERFLKFDENGKLSINQTKVKELFAFGGGHRRCIGENLGKKQVSQIFMYLLKHCRIEKSSLDCSDLEAQFGDVLTAQTIQSEVHPSHSVKGDCATK